MSVDDSIVELLNPPEDGITSLEFANKSDHLLVSSWDRTVRLYDTAKNNLLRTYDHEAPVLDCCVSSDDLLAFTVGISRLVKVIDHQSKTSRTLGEHKKPASRVVYAKSSGLVVTGGWDATVSLWDMRESKSEVASVTQTRSKVYTMDYTEKSDLASGLLVVGTSGRNIYVYDVRKLSEPLQKRVSLLSNQTRCVRLMPDGTGFVVASIEGRVGMEYLDSKEHEAKSYAFKCHRSKTSTGQQILYPVNAVAFHKVYGTFCSGGCDGGVGIWDYLNKKRLYKLPKFPTSVAALGINYNGSAMAIASSYTFEEGDKEHPPDQLFIKKLDGSEFKPKKKKTEG